MRKQKTINAVSFMAVATGSKSEEIKVKLLKGVGAFGVLAVNPTRAELNAIYKEHRGITLINTDEINYIGEGTAKDKDGKDIKVPQIRLTFILKTDPTIACNNGIDAIVPVSVFLNKAYTFSTKEGALKVQVIDEYGRTTWVTEEELKTHAIPEFKIKRGEHAGEMMKAQITKNYRPCYAGEEDLVKLIIALVNIPRPDDWNEDLHTYVMKSDPKELAKSECLLDDIKKYFDGNITELKKIIKFQPLNRFKLSLGIRTTSKGSQFQCAYTRMPMKLAVQSLKPLETALKEDKTAGRHPSEEYLENGVITNLHEIEIGATDYSKPEETKTEEPDPFAASAAAPGAPKVEAAPEVPDDLPPSGGDEDPFAA